MSFRWMAALGLTAVLPLLVACDSSPTEPAPGLPAVVQLQVSQTVVLASGSVMVRFVEVVSEGRCPAEVTCAWEGEAIIMVELRESGRFLGAPLLSTHLTQGSSPNSLRLGSFFLRLVELAPDPGVVGSPIRLSDYRLTLRIE